MLILAALVISALVVVGVRVRNSNQAKNADSAQTTIPEKITSTNDLTQADKALDAESIDQSLDSSQLDTDINALNQ